MGIVRSSIYTNFSGKEVDYMEKFIRNASLAIFCLLILCMFGMAAWASEEEGIKTIESVSAKPDLTPTAIKAYHYKWSSFLNKPLGDPWFNHTNYVNVSVKNKGAGDSGSFKVKLYVDGVQIGEKTISGLAAGSKADEKFEWIPIGKDPLSWDDSKYGSKISYTRTAREYMLKVVVDEANNVYEVNENNNNLTTLQKALWNGYTADEPLNNYLHGTIKGGMLYTTGTGVYCGVNTAGTKYDTYSTSAYDLDIPGTPVLSRLYIYYTWGQTPTKAPKLGVSLTTPSGQTHRLNLEKGYNDYKGEFGIWRYPWGTYAYNITEFVTESGKYSVKVTNLNDGRDQVFCSKYAFAAPAILTVYENKKMPLKEYWINEGADILIGGRRYDGGFLSSEECKNTAFFPGEVCSGNATLGIVSPWADSTADDYVWFNGRLLGSGLYRGYNAACSLEEGPIKMRLGRNSQVSIIVNNVTSDLAANDNVLIQEDNGDNIMAVNAFLMVDYTPSFIHANFDNVTVGVTKDVTFTVTSNNEPVEGAVITLTGCAAGSGTTGANGTVVISITATDKGDITATASKEWFASAVTTITVKPDYDAHSGVSLEAEIVPAISLVVSPQILDFGELSCGETSSPHFLNLSNAGGCKIYVAVDVTDVADDLFVDGLQLDSAGWGSYYTSIAVNDSNTVNVTLRIPENYTGLGNQTGGITFWAEAA